MAIFFIMKERKVFIVIRRLWLNYEWRAAEFYKGGRILLRTAETL